MPEYQITDQETGIGYIFNLTDEEYHRASKDLVYCTKLLENAKAEENTNNIEQQEMQSDFTEVYNDGFRWADEPTRLLLATYKTHENLLHTGKVSAKKFWELMSNKLNEKVYNVTGQQCKSKFNGLKKTYKNVKDYNNKSGNNKRTWPYYEIMDEMFGYKPWVKPILTLDSSNNILTSADPTCSSSSSNNNKMSSSPQSASSSNKGSRKRQKVTQDSAFGRLLAVMEENKEERKKMFNEAVIRQDRMLNILEKMVNKQ